MDGKDLNKDKFENQETRKIDKIELENLRNEQFEYEVNETVKEDILQDEFLVDNNLNSENEKRLNYEKNDDNAKNFNNQNNKNLDEEFKYNNYPNFFFSGFFTRLFAFIVDSIIAGALGKIIIDGAINLFLNDLYIPKKIYNLSHLLVFLLYFTIMTYATNGQTLGKMIFGIRVVSFTEKRLKLSTVIVREFFGRYIYSYGILFILYIICGFTAKKQHLSDMIVDTSVINENTIKAYELNNYNLNNNEMAY